MYVVTFVHSATVDGFPKHINSWEDEYDSIDDIRDDLIGGKGNMTEECKEKYMRFIVNLNKPKKENIFHHDDPECNVSCTVIESDF